MLRCLPPVAGLRRDFRTRLAREDSQFVLSFPDRLHTDREATIETRMETLADLIAAEDLLLFVNAAITSTGQREHYSEADEQRLALDFLHRYLLGNHRDLYSATLALEINDHNAILIVQNLLATTAEANPRQRRVEGRLIARRLALLPLPRVYRLFRELRRAGVNNRRTRAIMRDWLAARPDLAFDAVKYRGAVKVAVRHAHLRLADQTALAEETGIPDRKPGRRGLAGALGHELGPYLFRPNRWDRYTTPILESWRRAHHEQAALYDLPYTVAEGFAAKHGIARGAFLERIAPRLTRLERLRLQESARDLHADAVRADLTAMPLTRLASYVLALSLDDRVRRRAELTAALRAAARRTAGDQAGSWGRVVAVLDDSFSAYGSGEKRRRPLATALACHFLLEALASEYTPLWLSGRSDALLVYPHGTTPLGERILDALEGTPERLVIVSDGGTTRRPGWPARCCASGVLGSILATPAASCTSIRSTTPQTSTYGGWRPPSPPPASAMPRMSSPWRSWPDSQRAAPASSSCAPTWRTGSPASSGRTAPSRRTAPSARTAPSRRRHDASRPYRAAHRAISGLGWHTARPADP